MKMMSNQSYGNFIHPHLNDPQAQTVSAKMKNMNQTKFRENMRAFKQFYMAFCDRYIPGRGVV